MTGYTGGNIDSNGRYVLVAHAAHQMRASGGYFATRGRRDAVDQILNLGGAEV